MPLAAGDTLSHYRITAAIGAGGMGEVYRATDTKLGREVALKLLPDAFAADAERLARFEREAKVLASLNHTGIAHLYGFDGMALADGTRAHVLVMELVEGEDLAERLKRGAIPVEEALGIARQIAEAIEEAHEKGVVHRDLKPANVKLTPDGKVKVLDFGLAKAWTGEDATSAADLSQSPTLAHTGTAAGLILGTAAYMSPEQARGKRADKRADIWAFGVVLWEMLTGQRLFAGETVSDVLASVLKTEPDWRTLPDSTPESVRALLRRCLERAPLARLRDIGEARVLLSGRLEPPEAGAPVAAAWRRSPWRLALPWLLCAAAVAVAAALAVRRQPAPTRLQGPETIRLTLAGPGPEYSMDTSQRPVLSADGRTLAMALWGPEGNALFVRPLDSFGLVRIEGGGRRPFFSPDGRSLAFMRFGTVWKMDVAERRPSLVGRLNEDMWDSGFPAWHPDGRLLIPGAAGLWSIPASGGDAALLVASDLTAKERIQAVSVLSDGRLVLTVSTHDSARVEIRAADASGPHVVAVPAAGASSVDGGGRSGARRDGVMRDTDRGGVVGDVLFTLRSGQWRATRLDLRRLEATGPSVSLPDMPGESLLGPSLAWFPGSASLLRELVWVSRTGAATSLGIAPAYFRWPRLSPDARRLALGSSRDDAIVGTLTGVQVGVVDLQTGGRTWLDGFSEPVWTADGRRVVTSLGGQPFAGLGEQVADASRPIETIFTLDAGDAWPTSASRDGAWLVYYGRVPDGESNPAARDLSDIFVLDRRTGKRQRHSLPEYQRGGRLSPDASWLAYQTTDGARSDVRVRTFPALDADYTVSTEGGGQEPAWSVDGKELYYRRGPDMMRVKVPARGETVIWPPPEVLFTGNYAHDFFGDQSYDVAPDGRFLMLRPLAKEGVEIHVVLGWMAEVEARLRSSN